MAAWLQQMFRGGIGGSGRSAFQQRVFCFDSLPSRRRAERDACPRLHGRAERCARAISTASPSDHQC
uniref:Uncharacterized protein n=1 Tax=Setaria italica TaxID=4555 RepID=K3Y3T2_SETIT